MASGNPTTHSTWQRLSGLTTKKWDENAPTGFIIGTRDNSALNNKTYPATNDDMIQVEDGTQGLNQIPTEVQDESNENSPTETAQERERSTSRLMEQTTSHYGRVRRLTRRLQDAIEHRALSSTLTLQEDMESSIETTNPIAMLSTTNKDTMYYHQAMQQEDAPEFVNAMINEINDHVNRKHWRLVPRESVPRNTKILPSVWSMKRKRTSKCKRCTSGRQG